MGWMPVDSCDAVARHAAITAAIIDVEKAATGGSGSRPVDDGVAGIGDPQVEVVATLPAERHLDLGGAEFDRRAR